MAKVIFGFLAGIIGGMGMGGGTLLVPLLSFLDLGQKVIQGANLISFVPMCTVALIFHSKNHLLRKKHTLWMIVPACIFSALGAFVTKYVSGDELRYVFAVGVIAVGIYQLTRVCKSFKRKK